MQVGGGMLARQILLPGRVGGHGNVEPVFNGKRVG